MTTSTTEPVPSGSHVLDYLEGRCCEFCRTGNLVRTEFKGNDAVVCDCCGTPAAQFW